MNNKGFTLVEIIVAMAISSLILIMAIPSINNMTHDTRNEEFTKYRDSIIQGAKLYYSTKEADLYWVTDENGNEVSSVTFRQLLDSGYVKYFNENPKENSKRCNTDEGEEDNVLVEITRQKSTATGGNRVSGSGKVTYKVYELRCGTTELDTIQ